MTILTFNRVSNEFEVIISPDQKNLDFILKLLRWCLFLYNIIFHDSSTNTNTSSTTTTTSSSSSSLFENLKTDRNQFISSKALIIIDGLPMTATTASTYDDNFIKYQLLYRLHSLILSYLIKLLNIIDIHSEHPFLCDIKNALDKIFKIFTQNRSGSYNNNDNNNNSDSNNNGGNTNNNDNSTNTNTDFCQKAYMSQKLRYESIKAMMHVIKLTSIVVTLMDRNVENNLSLLFINNLLSTEAIINELKILSNVNNLVENICVNYHDFESINNPAMKSTTNDTIYSNTRYNQYDTNNNNNNNIANLISDQYLPSSTSSDVLNYRKFPDENITTCRRDGLELVIQRMYQ